MYRLSRLRYIFPIGLFITFFLDGSISKVFSGWLFSYPYSTVSHLVVLWLVLACFFEEDIKIPLVPFAAVAGLVFDLYYSGIVGLFMFLFPLIVGLTKTLAKYFSPTFLTAIMIFFIDIAFLELVNYFAYSLIGVISSNFGDFLIYVLAPTLALNLIYLVILYFPIHSLFERSLQEKN
ncbi:rod shape-determining protein MreD [Paucilactobacillus hokkaidonensis JCM 18461]|uniref:Rod shape-determining protein MreD n=2 Tax=Paucilactobacillus hokkaidonensis TaxID=1193095 RepID=A0A0A1GYL5_9LACO|nr:rod shape-determining protein MreD [Paucilactobacillus hokkaidonensis]KRO10544.1 cell shape determining protein MreD [Paucilactobacillus hokkaidonensis]BAP86063.1 rod shape-determining protein MreD [Paucilactobacillus hokkaidonensis JCM 18461]